MPPDSLSDIRLVQLARLLSAREHSLPIEEVRARAAADTGRLATTLLAEAADSDDVLSAADAIAFLEDRLHFFGDALSRSTADRVRHDFAELVRQWDSA
ncbi:hypothetical protein AYO38_11430 [bacterium SCGC AG-212-C10]|nr:hypothetical protein AYO38_11430 [bacterium SCGC AG-212-C10]